MRLQHSTIAALGTILLVAPIPRAAASPDGAAAIDPTGAQVEPFPAEATVHGKYCTLLRQLHCPEDLPAYNRFTDYGMYTGTSWHNYTNLPPGYWVYVYPDWYIWRDGPGPGGTPPANAPKK